MVAPPKIAPPDPWLTTEEAAKYLEYSASYLRLLCQRGAIKCQKVGRKYRLRQSWCEAHLQRTTRGPDGGGPPG